MLNEVSECLIMHALLRDAFILIDVLELVHNA